MRKIMSKGRVALVEAKEEEQERVEQDASKPRTTVVLDPFGSPLLNPPSSFFIEQMILPDTTDSTAPWTVQQLAWHHYIS
jgi:hypothetical protein